MPKQSSMPFLWGYSPWFHGVWILKRDVLFTQGVSSFGKSEGLMPRLLGYVD